MKKIVFLALVLVLLSTLAFDIQPVTSEVQVGVKAGDWIKFTFTFSAYDPRHPEWLKVEFLSVVDAIATIRVTAGAPNGTEYSETMTIDVMAGYGGGETFLFPRLFVPANCRTGDSIYIHGYGDVRIAGETIRAYAGASRTVVYASFWKSDNTITYYWDEQTGVIVEVTQVSDTTEIMAVTETNMWEAAPTEEGEEVPFWMQWWLWTIVAVVIVALAATFYFLKKRKPPTPTAPPPPTEGTL